MQTKHPTLATEYFKTENEKKKYNRSIFTLLSILFLLVSIAFFVIRVWRRIRFRNCREKVIYSEFDV